MELDAVLSFILTSNNASNYIFKNLAATINDNNGGVFLSNTSI